MIDEIRKSEEAAAEKRKRAQTSSREILQKAREDGEELIRKAETASRREAARIQEKTQAEIRALTEASQKDEADKRAAALQNGSEKLDGAVDFLLSRLKKEKSAP